MGVNKSAVCGTITAGTGCSTLQEMLAAMAIPCMSHVTYRKYRDRLHPGFAAAVDEETKRATAEERAEERSEERVNLLPSMGAYTQRFSSYQTAVGRKVHTRVVSTIRCLVQLQLLVLKLEKLSS